VGKNVLVVSTVEHPEDVLRAEVGEADTIKVVMPVVQVGVLDWLANDQEAFRAAATAANRAASRLPAGETEGVADAANVDLAIRDALATFPADEIVVAIRPDEDEGLIESMVTDSAPRHSVEGVPVRTVVIRDQLSARE
jgi:hypothetical protein